MSYTPLKEHKNDNSKSVARVRVIRMPKFILRVRPHYAALYISYSLIEVCSRYTEVGTLLCLQRRQRPGSDTSTQTKKGHTNSNRSRKKTRDDNTDTLRKFSIGHFLS